MKKLLLYLLSILPLFAQAAVLVNGIYYNINDISNTAEVTYNPHGEYNGDISISETIDYKGKTYSVTSIGLDAFNNCSGLTSITIPNSVVSIGPFAFYFCSGLTSITIPNSVLSIESYAFEGTPWYDNQPDGLIYAGQIAYKYKGQMPSYQTITLKEGTLAIAPTAFMYCDKLTSITMPNSVTTIGSQAFQFCRFLETITIPQSVTSIGEYAFDSCASLTEVFCFAESVPETGIGVFTTHTTGTATLYVPTSALDNYKNSKPWSDFCRIISIDGNSTDISSICPYTFQLQNDGGKLSILGTPEGERIRVYTLSGQLLVTATATSVITNINTSLNAGEACIVKVGDKSMKILLR